MPPPGAFTASSAPEGINPDKLGESTDVLDKLINLLPSPVSVHCVLCLFLNPLNVLCCLWIHLCHSGLVYPVRECRRAGQTIADVPLLSA